MQRTVEGIGNVIFRKSDRAKQVNITVKPFVDVVVSVPKKVAYKQAEGVLRDNIAWVRREQSRMRDVEQKFTVFELEKEYVIKDQKIRIEVCEEANLGYRVNGNTTHIYVPRSAADDALEVQTYIRSRLEKIMRSWCKDNLANRVQEFASKYHVPLQKVTFRKTYTRWGSYSDKNNLNLSIYLATLPDHLIDYVILHELAHHKIRNHSKTYWMHLRTMVDDPMRLDKELRGWPIGVF